ncbi:DUF262 domain-containing protein [Bauldia litoralis]|uniref:GmrSD restriction endonucleases N-terminal domain-containing protein n=1 Tax=Bauldia litoralis TaxID=665467 RepID=A0A1G6DVW3_9HYPH|nr:Protein of unknown function DUF262 [Bauldia litoralis]
MTDLFTALEDSDVVAQVVDEARREARYIVTDFTFEIITTKFREEAESEGDIYVPDYQRKLAWTEAQQSYLIESLILRYPIPPLFFYDIRGRLEIVDGTQRVRSMVRFARGDLALQKLEKLDILNGFHFDQLPEPVRLRLNNTPVRAFVLDDATEAGLRADLFRRLKHVRPDASGRRSSQRCIQRRLHGFDCGMCRI